VSARRTPGEHALRASVASATTKRKSFCQREKERERERTRTDASTYARWPLGWLSAVSTVGAVCLFLPRIAVNCSGPAGRDRARSRVSARAIRPVRTRPRGGETTRGEKIREEPSPRDSRAVSFTNRIVGTRDRSRPRADRLALCFPRDDA